MLGIEALGQYAVAQIPATALSILSFPVSGLNWRNMQVLGYNSTGKLLYDNSNTGDFFVLQNSTLYRVTPFYASTWFCDNPGVTIVYNPFVIGYPQLYLQFPYKDVD